MTSTSAPTQRFDLEHLSFEDAVRLGQVVRTLGRNCASQQEAAQKVVGYLYGSFCDASSGACDTALVRCFQTHPFRGLPPGTQAVAEALLGGAPADDLRCLTLLGTRGDEPAWNQLETSAGHRVIPLPNVSMIERAPMIAGLLSQMGVEAKNVVLPPTAEAELVLDVGRRSFNVFHVEEARGSALIPAQQTFVEQHGIRSVIGMGGLLPSGELFAVILFAKVCISRETAALFRTLALSVKLAFVPFAETEVFERPA